MRSQFLESEFQQAQIGGRPPSFRAIRSTQADPTQRIVEFMGDGEYASDPIALSFSA